MASQDCLSGRYRLLEWLGAGGMAVVWSAFDEVLERPVAVKLPAMPADDALRHRIQREARSAARLVHPHIAGVYDYGETEAESESADGQPCPYVVMELVSGVPLSQRLTGAGERLPWAEAATICAQIASALAEAHAHGVVHRDVKPANVMLTRGGAKLVDFGIAAAIGETEDESDLLGTPAYIAPERLARTVVGAATDVYGLGLVLYRALAGRMPWDAETVTQVLSAHLSVDPQPLPALTGVPAEVIRICEACLAKEPAARPTSAEVARALSAAAGVAVPLPRTSTTRFAAGQATVPPHMGTVAFGGSKRARTVALTVGAFAAAILFTTSAAAGGSPAPARMAMLGGVPEPFQCGVTYRVESAGPDQFDAVVQVARSAGEVPADATLRFTFPGDQALAGPTDGVVQDGRDVVTPLRQWEPDGTVTLRLGDVSGSYNPMPTAFSVNGSQCAALVSGPPSVAPPSSENHGGPGDSKPGPGKKKDRR